MVEGAQTEIQFILDLLLNHKLHADVKKKCIERIGKVEAVMAVKPQPISHPMRAVTPDAAPTYTPPAAARIVGGEVQTGPGTKGPRKF